MNKCKRGAWEGYRSNTIYYNTIPFTFYLTKLLTLRLDTILLSISFSCLNLILTRIVSNQFYNCWKSLTNNVLLLIGDLNQVQEILVILEPFCFNTWDLKQNGVTRCISARKKEENIWIMEQKVERVKENHCGGKLGERVQGWCNRGSVEVILSTVLQWRSQDRL